ncbi:putative electron-transferring-flavoprotein dehydrogenase [Saccharomycopsis crataegensis]|uniref:Electron transfer flavoprotein-ubiquinone oxidoreductase n=1 Tax=Saccharomycopsis crataegensis TaxID=43959 RepID=A0AAV5QF61_9ASCO|nr:putative electron-transferring-flavoprotein dehydrogenase [Saccharomycopsis crataegensis]
MLRKPSSLIRVFPKAGWRPVVKRASSHALRVTFSNGPSSPLHRHQISSSRPFSSTSRAYNISITEEELEILNEERAIDNVDVCIVGGGPAGLATAIKLKQLDHDDKLRIVVLEKAGDMGAHIISGAVLEPRALRELFPDSEFYDENGEGIPLPPELVTKVTKDSMRFLFDEFSVPLPEPPQMINKDKNYIVSLNQVVQHLAGVAEEMGIEVYPGIAVSEVIYGQSDDGSSFVKGIATKDMGISKTGKPKDSFERGMEFHSKITVFAEGCHGSLSKQVISKFNLRANSEPQTYGLGIKEVWELDPAKFEKGLVAHSVGYPLNNEAYGGGFMYHFGDGLASIGLVIGLDYENPWINPYQEFQLMKHHPFYKQFLEGGKCISYGARTLNEGGIQSVPKLHFPGGVLVGATAGFMNVPKIKGTHTAMKSGMLAAESIFAAIKDLPSANELAEQEEMEEEEGEAQSFSSKSQVDIPPIDLSSYQTAFKNSWVYEELDQVRNVRPSFNSPFGLYGGLVYSGIDTLLLKGQLNYTFSHRAPGVTDANVTKPASEYQRIEYPKPDGKISFDILTSVSRTGTYHSEDEESHLRLTTPSAPFKSQGANDQETMNDHVESSYQVYQGVENRFCPAGVYEYLEDGDKMKFQINSQNCIHCKTCDIKVPTQDINWSVPEGGDGPKYYMT